MLPLESIVVRTILLAIAATASSKVTSAEIEERSEILEDSNVVHYEDVKRVKRETERPPEEEASYPLRRESSADELAAAVRSENVGYQDTGNHVNEHPRQAVGDGWRDAVPGTPGMDYPNLDGIPVTSFTCMDKQPGGYYADVETGCQVFHVCNTGGVKSSFLCPPGSIFNQRHFVCDWWYGFNCQEAEDLYFKKPDENFDELNEDSITSVIGNSETTSPVTESIDSFPSKYSQESRLHNDVNPSNNLPLTGSGQETLGHLTRQGSRRIDEPSSHYENNIPEYSDEPRNLKNLDNEATDGYVPKGFSLNDDQSLKHRKFDRSMNSHDLTNDLASYVNYAYFQAGFNHNMDHNDDDDDNNDNIPDSSDQIELDYHSKSFGDKV